LNWAVKHKDKEVRQQQTEPESSSEEGNINLGVIARIAEKRRVT
jgi:hypothetical protein